MSENVEHDWVERARQGEPAAIAELYQRYWRAARAAAYGVTADLSLAEDAASEAFCTALDGLSDLRDIHRFGPWLRTITVRTARRLQKSASTPKPAASAVPPVAEARAPGERLEQQELAALVHEAVRALPPPLRQAVSLFYLEGYRAEEAARFLDVPAGTLKRRLHDGRQRLQSAAEQILRGSRPMNEERERILQQLREAAEEGLDSEAFYGMMRKATRLGPVPRELLADIMKRHFAGKIPTEGRVIPPEKEEVILRRLRRFHEPSERAQDPSHPVGAVANAIRDALPAFTPWQIDVSKIDLNAAARMLHDTRAQALAYLLPPGFAEETSGAHITAERGLLIKDEDGSVLTVDELIGKKDTQAAFHERMREGSRLSDVLGLVWKQPEPLDLRAVEDLLRELSAAIVPGVAVRFLPLQEPRFRASLRMQLGTSPIPAARGGVLNPSSIARDGTSVAAAMIYLEPWASTRSGQTIELAEGSVFPLEEDEAAQA
jgi:RNA polymerase sigma factor (sigma-70 family)